MNRLLLWNMLEWFGVLTVRLNVQWLLLLLYVQDCTRNAQAVNSHYMVDENAT